jgi:hypothetical protein
LPVHKDTFIRLGKKYAELHANNKVSRMNESEIANIIIKNGMLNLKGVDFKESWFSKEGEYISIPLNAMSNQL